MNNTRLNIFSLFVFLFVMSLYWLTLSPSVSVGDSGEFITNAVTLGINHTTGYPLYTLVASTAVQLLPLIPAAVVANLISALFASLAAVFVFRTMLILTTNVVFSLFAGFLFSCSLTVWESATIAEVYTLNALGIAVVFSLIVRWMNTEKRFQTEIYAIAFFSGLLLTNHVTTLLVLFSVAGFFFAQWKKTFGSFDVFLLSVCFFLLGTSVYLYLPVRSSNDPPLDWLNPESLRNLADYFFPYAKRKVFGHDTGGLLDRIIWIGQRLLTREWFYFGTLAGLGLRLSGGLLKERRAFFWMLISIIIVNIGFATIRRQPLEGDFASLLIPSVIVIVILSGVGIASLWKEFEVKWKISRQVKIISAIIVFLIPCFVMFRHYERTDQHANRFAEQFASDLLDGIPDDAIIFTNGDEQTFLPWYYKFVDGRCRKMTVVNWDFLNTTWHSESAGRELGMNLLSVTGGSERCRMIVSRFIKERPIYFLQQLPFEWIQKKYRAMPNGFSYAIVSQDDSSRNDSAIKRFVPDFHPSFDERTTAILNYYPRMHLLNAQVWEQMGKHDLARQELDALSSFPITVSERALLQESAKKLKETMEKRTGREKLKKEKKSFAQKRTN